jgi:Cu-Zn family superoxide dismutase
VFVGRARERFGASTACLLDKREEVPVRISTISAAIMVFGLAACGSSTPESQEAAPPATPTATPMEAVAMLQTADGQPAGRATAAEAPGGLAITLNVEGLAPGEHGVHVHTTGSCEPPKFESAGGHWNPTERQHGLDNPQGHHAGDMPNLTVAADGTGTLEYTLAGATLAGLLDADGSAFVVHAMGDDQKTDPSGDSGDRIACGVFSAT